MRKGSTRRFLGRWSRPNASFQNSDKPMVPNTFRGTLPPDAEFQRQNGTNITDMSKTYYEFDNMWHHLFSARTFIAATFCCSHLATSQAMFEDDFLNFWSHFQRGFSFIFFNKVATFHRWLWVAEEPLSLGYLQCSGAHDDEDESDM